VQSGKSLRISDLHRPAEARQRPRERILRIAFKDANHAPQRATGLPLKEVTARTGLGDASTFWRVFTQDLGVTPSEYRQRFAKEWGTEPVQWG